MIKINFVFSLLFYFVLIACTSKEEKIKNKLEQLQSSPIVISYNEFECWTNESINEIATRKHATFKLVHYVDSSRCSSCYLTKLAPFHDLFILEHESNNQFQNIFIVNPGTKKMNKMILKDHHAHNETPSTLFIDSMNVFIKENPHIPSETMYHTFLVDENNNVIFVGNPVGDSFIKKKIFKLVKDKLLNMK